MENTKDPQAAAPPSEVPVEPIEADLMVRSMAQVQLHESNLGRLQADYERRKQVILEELARAEAQRMAVIEAIAEKHLGEHRLNYAFDPARKAFLRR